MVLKLAHQCPRGIALGHPAFEKRHGRVPEVELRVELAAQSLDVEQGFLQQDQRGLHRHIEACGGAKQVDQQLAEGDFGNGPLEDGFADRAHGRLEVLDARIRRHPAAFDMQARDLVVVAAENRQQVAPEIVLVGLAERADNRAVDGDVTGVFGVAGIDEDVARVHVRVEKTIAKHLGKENLHAALAEHLEIDPFGAQRVQRRDRDAVNALHYHDPAPRIVPEHFRHIDQAAIGEVAPQL